MKITTFDFQQWFSEVGFQILKKTSEYFLNYLTFCEFVIKWFKKSPCIKQPKLLPKAPPKGAGEEASATQTKT
jgi:hypothetical protein